MSIIGILDKSIIILNGKLPKFTYHFKDNFKK